MRLSINLDDDLYAVAKSLARAEDVSLSSAINLLVRRALEPKSEKAEMPEDGTGLPVIRGRRVVTSEDIYRLDWDVRTGRRVSSFSNPFSKNLSHDAYSNRRP